jgi:hypothetical protein
MMRDMELIRKILLVLEEAPTGYAPSDLKVDGYDEETVGHHVHLMGQGGLLDVIDVSAQQDSSPTALPLSITWKGHEFIASAKEPAVWKRGVELAKKAGSSALPVLIKALTEAALERMRLQ